MADQNLIAHGKHQDYADEMVHYRDTIRVSLITPSGKHIAHVKHAYALCIHRQHYYY